MDSHRFARVKTILHALESLHADQHAAHLDEACGADAELRREVESLLSQHTGKIGFLDSGALQRAARSAFGDTHQPAAVPERIGPYQILDKLGEGGMGVVYRAEQTSRSSAR